MSLWFVLSLMTAVAILAVLLPLGRKPALAVAGAAHETAVYRDQLDELSRDRAVGLISEPEAAAARAEIGRRLLAAADAAAGPGAPADAAIQWRRRAVSVLALIALPVIAVALYGKLGSPSLPSAPLAERAKTPLEARPIDSLIAQVEEHLAKNPDDGRGWEVIAPVYLRLGRFEDAVVARRNALRLLGATAVREANLGEALVYAANGVVTDEARAAFGRALALDAKEMKARYFIGLAAEQDGRPAEAAALWRALLADAPPDAPWRDLVERALARVADGAPGPSADDVAEAEKLPPEQRTAMVRGMVERLAARLKENGADVEGWLRLVRAYVVLGELDKARSAAADARRALASEPDKAARIDALMKALGLEG